MSTQSSLFELVDHFDRALTPSNRLTYVSPDFTVRIFTEVLSQVRQRRQEEKLIKQQEQVELQIAAQNQKAVKFADQVEETNSPKTTKSKQTQAKKQKSRAPKADYQRLDQLNTLLQQWQVSQPPAYSKCQSQQ